MSKKFDKKDMKILESIADSARLSYSEIGKFTRISKDRVRERINRMKSQKFILSFVPLINYSSFGYHLFNAYVNFRSTITKENSLVNLLKDHPKIISLTKMPGRYELEIQFLAKSKIEAKNIIKKINLESFGEVIELCILKPERLYIYTMSLNSVSKSKVININEKDSSRINVDKLDIEILKLLSINSREKLVDMSFKLKTNVDTLRYRIKRLVNDRVIQGFYTRTHKHGFNLSSYIFLIALKKNLSSKQLDSISRKTNVYYAKSFSGKWNLVINLHAKNNKDLISTLDYLRKILKDNLLKSELLILLERYFFVPIPRNFSLS